MMCLYIMMQSLQCLLLKVRERTTGPRRDTAHGASQLPETLKLALLASPLGGLAKARHPAPAKQGASAQAPQASLLPAQQSLSPKEGEGASTEEGAPMLVHVRKPSARRPLSAPRVLPLRAISASKRCSNPAGAQSTARFRRLKPAAQLSPRYRC